MLIINDAAKKAPLTEDFKSRADIDSDGGISLSDAMYIIEFAARNRTAYILKNKISEAVRKSDCFY